jgi:hypothetical protein
MNMEKVNIELETFKYDGKYGFKDKNTGKIVIPLKYDDAWLFMEGLASVKLNDKWGFIDKTGEIVVPFNYDFDYYFWEGL